jgi:hypothetical protein
MKTSGVDRLLRGHIDAALAGEVNSQRLRAARDLWPLWGTGVAAVALLITWFTVPAIWIPDTSLGWVDAWFYVSFAKWLPENLAAYPTLYHGERLAWTLPGYLANQIASPLTANYITKAAFFIALIAFLLGAVKQTTNLRTAIFASTLAASYSFLVHSIGANYVDGAANMYFVVALFFINRAIQPTISRWNAFAAGVAYFALVLSHIIFVLVLPLFVGYVVLTWMQISRSSVRQAGRPHRPRNRTHAASRSWGRWALDAVLLGLAIAAFAAAGALAWFHFTMGPPAQRVNVRWAPALSVAERVRAEREHGLVDGALFEGRTWRYYVRRRSPSDIQELVRDPRVEDTYHIDRALFRIQLDRPDLSPRARAWLETDRLDQISFALALIAAVITWWSRRTLRAVALALRAVALALRGATDLFGVFARFIAGAGVGYAVTLAIYRFWRVRHLPLQSSFRILVAHDENPDVWPRSWEWLLGAFWLALPSAVLVWVLTAMVRSVRTGGWPALARVPPLHAFFIAMCGMFFGMFVMKSPVLMLPFYASYLIPLTFLALGPILMPLIERLSVREYLSLVVFVFWLAGTAYLFADVRFERWAGVLMAACLSFATLLNFRPVGSTRMYAWSFLLLVALAIAAVDLASADYDRQVRNAYKFTSMGEIYNERAMGLESTLSRADRFAAAVSAATELRPRLVGKRYYFWYDRDDRLGMLFRSVGSLFFAWQTRRLLNEQFPRFEPAMVPLLPESPSSVIPNLLVLSSNRHESIPEHPELQIDFLWTQELHAGKTPFFAHYFAVKQSVASSEQSAFVEVGSQDRGAVNRHSR